MNRMLNIFLPNGLIEGIKTRSHKNLILLIILFIAAIIRFWYWPEMQFHHDELSALMRTRFQSFDELIMNGVWVDGHPAFTQVFLWVWTALLGYNPMLVKLPFILAGVVSVYLVYYIAKQLFNYKSAFVSGALMAVLQYSVVYSQWARPYAFGLLFMLSAFYFLLKYSDENRKISLLGFSVMAALTAYTHYFALLQVITLSGFWFLFRLNKNQRIWFLAASLLAFAFWLPHLHLTLHHLSLGGIGDWLKVPKPDYWMELLGFSVHYSWFVVLPLILAIAVYVLKARFNRSVLLLQFLLLGSWILPYLITYFYSTEVSALMHFGTMLFTFPSLVLFAGSLFASFDKSFAKIAMLFTLVFGLQTLVEREHFRLNIKTEFQEPIHKYHALKARDFDLTALFDLRGDAVAFLDQNSIEDMSEVQLVQPLVDSGELAAYLNELKSENVLLVTQAGSAKEVFSTVTAYFPEVLELYSYQSATAYLLTRSIQSKEMNKESPDNLKGLEYGESVFYSPSDSLGFDNLFFRINWAGQLENRALMVVDWKSNHNDSLWQASELTEFITENQFQLASMSFDLRDMPGFEFGGEFSAYVWNRGLDSIDVLALEIEQYPSNRLRYGLFKRINN